jgi:hypothetical protein
MGLVKGVYYFGCSLAICISWSVDKTISMAVLHGVCSWIYVAYYAMKESKLLD